MLIKILSTYKQLTILGKDTLVIKRLISINQFINLDSDLAYWEETIKRKRGKPVRRLLITQLKAT